MRRTRSAWFDLYISIHISEVLSRRASGRPTWSPARSPGPGPRSPTTPETPPGSEFLTHLSLREAPAAFTFPHPKDTAAAPGETAAGPEDKEPGRSGPPKTDEFGPLPTSRGGRPGRPHVPGGGRGSQAPQVLLPAETRRASRGGRLHLRAAGRRRGRGRGTGHGGHRRPLGGGGARGRVAVGPCCGLPPLRPGTRKVSFWPLTEMEAA